MRSGEIAADESDGYTPSINAYHRILDLLDELDPRSSD